MLADKSPSMDAYPVELFIRNWGLVGNEVCQDILDFFETWKLMRALNCTFITLVPKVASPTQIKDYRLIVYCMTLHKIIPKYWQWELKLFQGDHFIYCYCHGIPAKTDGSACSK